MWGVMHRQKRTTQETLVSPTLLRYRCLGSDAFYRALDVREDRVVDLEVVDAPGLTCGVRVRVTRAAASRMTRVCGPRLFIGSASASISR